MLYCSPDYEEDVLLNNAEYNWYQYNTDGTVSMIPDEHNSYYETSAFISPEIRKYYCDVLLRVEKNKQSVLLTKRYVYNVAFTGLPTVYINTDQSKPIESKTEKVHGIIQILSSGNEVFETDILINGRGNTGWYGTPKKSYNIKFDNKESLLGMGKSKKWALIDNYHDRSLLRNSYVSFLNHNVFTKIGWNPSYTHVDVVLNGEYIGNYLLAERNTIEKERLNIKDVSKVENIEEGGFLCEINERFDEPYNFRTTHGVNAQSGDNIGIAVSLKDPDEVSETIQERVTFIVQRAEDALFSDDFCNPALGYEKYYDVISLIDWYLIHELVCMYDASSFYTSAFFYYDPEDEKIHMGPCWDYDTAMRSEVLDLELMRINSWYSQLFEDDSFFALVQERWVEIFDCLTESVAEIDKMATKIALSAEFNFRKWKVLGTHYEGIDAWENLSTYNDQVEFLSNWVERRIEILNGVFGVAH